jgi:hypothetical protein
VKGEKCPEGSGVEKINLEARTGLIKNFVNQKLLILVRYWEQGLTIFGFGY